MTGPDAKKPVADLSANSPSGFYAERCSQMILCNEEGYMVADGILYCLPNDEYELVGPVIGADWVEFHGLTGGYDVRLTRDDRSPSYPNGEAFTRKNYRLQIQGPNAV